MVEIPSLLIAKVIVKTTERNKEIYMYCKFGQACVTNWASFVLLQIRQTLLQVGTASLSQIGASVVTNWGSYYKLGQLLLQNRAAITNWGKTYYKLGQVLQIKAIITNWAKLITNWGRYYKLRQLLQIGQNLLQIGAGITN